MILKVQIPDGDKCFGCRFLNYTGMLGSGLYKCSFFGNFLMSKYHDQPVDSPEDTYKVPECLSQGEYLLGDYIKQLIEDLEYERGKPQCDCEGDCVCSVVSDYIYYNVIQQLHNILEYDKIYNK